MRSSWFRYVSCVFYSIRSFNEWRSFYNTAISFVYFSPVYSLCKSDSYNFIDTVINGVIYFSRLVYSSFIDDSCSFIKSLSSFFALTIVYPLSRRSSNVWANPSSKYKNAFFFIILQMSIFGTLLLFFMWKALVRKRKLDDVAKELLEKREKRRDSF